LNECAAKVYSTYLGGASGSDTGYGIVLDYVGTAYVTGSTASSNFPTTVGAYQTTQPDVQAVPVGEGFIDYKGFLTVLREHGFNGYVAYEMCSPLRDGGSLETLDRYARRFVEFMRPWI
jgi:sugar phosphate isomerase/epimerase